MKKGFLFIAAMLLALGLCGCDKSEAVTLEECSAALTAKAAEVKAKGPGTLEGTNACGQTIEIGMSDTGTVYFKVEMGGSSAINVELDGKEVQCVLQLGETVQCTEK